MGSPFESVASTNVQGPSPPGHKDKLDVRLEQILLRYSKKMRSTSALYSWGTSEPVPELGDDSNEDFRDISNTS